MGNSGSKEWVTVKGEARPETPSQHALLETPYFQLALSLYRRAINNNMSTAENKRMHLNQSMQEAYNQDIAVIHYTP